MANTTISPNMNLILPTVGVDPGPDWATNLNSSLTIIDAHNHASSSGVQITPNGLNINSDLSFNSNNAIALNSVRFTPLLAPISGSAPNLGCLYESGVDLYYNDGSGNQVRITQSGGVAGSPGSISGLTSPASATYVGGSQTFVWQSAASTAANMDMGSIILRNITAGSNGITITPPAGLSSNFTYTLPGSLPGNTSFLTVDNSGNMASNISTTAGITGSMIASQTVAFSNLAPYTGTQYSSSCGNFSSSSGAFVDITNLTVTITTKGGPVILGLMNDGSTNQSYWQMNSTAVTASSEIAVLINGTLTYRYLLYKPNNSGLPDSIIIPAPAILCADAQAAGTYTYKLQMQIAGSGTGYLQYYKLYAYEL